MLESAKAELTCDWCGTFVTLPLNRTEDGAFVLANAQKQIDEMGWITEEGYDFCSWKCRNESQAHLYDLD